MSLKTNIERWKEYPNALGSESQVAVIIGEIAAKLGEPIPENVNNALKILALRGTMRDIASAIERNEEHIPRVRIPSFHEVVDTGAASCGISWAEAVAVITKYLEEQQNRID